MERYNYHAAIKSDIQEYIDDNYTQEEILEQLKDKDAFIEKLHDDLWVEDSITGNASGSYTFNTWQADEFICHNLDLLKDALEEFGGDYAKALERGSEYCDVTIRCYLLGSAIYEVVKEIEEELEENFERCSFCGEWFEKNELDDGLCTYCQQEMKSRGEI